MQSRFLFAALACAFGFSSGVHADPLSVAPAAGPSNLQSRLLASPAAATPADAATGAATKHTGKMIVKIDAANRSALPTNSKIVCSVILYFGMYFDQSRIYTAPAVVTPSKVGCSVAAPYQLTTDAPQSISITVIAFMTNTTMTATNPLPNGFGFVELGSPSIPLPPNGAVTTHTISTVL
jgi:hypothetical protein